MKKTKIMLFIIAAAIYVAFVIFKFPEESGLCTINDDLCAERMDTLQGYVAFSPFLLVVTLVSFLLPPRYFQGWWRFARWGGPLTIVVVMLVGAGLHHTTGGWMNMNDILDDEAISAMYLFFIVGSAMQLWWSRNNV